MNKEATMNKISIVLLILFILALASIGGGIYYYEGRLGDIRAENLEQKNRLENLGQQILDKNNKITELETETTSSSEEVTRLNEQIEELDKKIEELEKQAEETEE